MVNWQDPKLVARLGAAQMPVLFFCIGIIFYDQIYLLKFDYNLLKASRRRRLPLLAYFGAKISWWIYAVLCILGAMGVGPYNCNAMVRALEFFMSLIALCSSSLLAVRTVCVWQDEKAKRIVGWTVGFFTFALSAVWFAGVADIHLMWVPNGGGAWQNGVCAPIKVEMRYFVKYIMTIVYDALVLVLTVAGVFRMSTNGRTRIGALLVQQGLLYFLATLAANLVPAVITILQLSPFMSLYFAVPSSFVAVLASTRLYVQLAQEATSRVDSQGRQQRHGENNNVQWGSGGTGSNGSTSFTEKLSNFMHRNAGNNNSRASRIASPTAPGAPGAARGIVPKASCATTVGGPSSPHRKKAPAFYNSAHHDDSLDIRSFQDSAASSGDLEKQPSPNNNVGVDSSLAHGVSTTLSHDHEHDGPVDFDGNAPVLPAPFVAAIDLQPGEEGRISAGSRPSFQQQQPAPTLSYCGSENDAALPSPVSAQTQQQGRHHPFSAAGQAMSNVRLPRVAVAPPTAQSGRRQQSTAQDRSGLTGIIVEQTKEEMSE